MVSLRVEIRLDVKKEGKKEWMGGRDGGDGSTNNTPTFFARWESVRSVSRPSFPIFFFYLPRAPAQTIV